MNNGIAYLDAMTAWTVAQADPAVVAFLKLKAAVDVLKAVL